MPETKFQKRQIAYKTRISEIISGTYIKEEGWTPNYIKTPDGRQLSRINILGTVLAVEEDVNFQSATIDDGSGKITIRTFEKTGLLNNLDIGDIVLVIGRPREYSSERYILIEIIRKIKNPAWLKLRSIELKTKQQPAPQQSTPQPKQEIKQRGIVEL